MRSTTKLIHVLKIGREKVVHLGVVDGSNIGVAGVDDVNCIGGRVFFGEFDTYIEISIFHHARPIV